MKRFLITGINGFVGKYLLNELIAQHPNGKFIGIGRSDHKLSLPNNNFSYFKLDLNKKKQLEDVFPTINPNFIIHLASESSVDYSWKFPRKCFENNSNIFLNILECVRKYNKTCRVLSIGSSEQYGKVPTIKIPLKEEERLNPISPYAVARVAQEMLSKVYTEGYGLDIVMTRSFNHFGPGQDKRFVIPSFIAKTLARKTEQSLTPIEVGNLEIIRDFVDVRDVVKAYTLLLEKGKTGNIYNICSGAGVKLKEILNLIMEILNYRVPTKINPNFIRPNDNPVIIGSNHKITENIGWKINYSLKESIEDTIKYFEQQYENII